LATHRYSGRSSDSSNVVCLVDSPASAKRGASDVTTEQLITLIQDVQEDFEREEDQGLMQEDLGKARHALAGKHACARILRVIEAREGIRIVNPRHVGRAR